MMFTVHSEPKTLVLMRQGRLKGRATPRTGDCQLFLFMIKALIENLTSKRGCWAAITSSLPGGLGAPGPACGTKSCDAQPHHAASRL